MILHTIVALLLIPAALATSWYPYPPYEMPEEQSEPVKFVLTFPAYFRSSKPFIFNLVLFESSEYALPVEFTATLTDSSGKLLMTQDFTQRSYGLQQHAFSPISVGQSSDMKPTVAITFKHEKLNKYKDLTGRPGSLAEHFVFIQTDKAIYKPTQTVHFRVLALSRELLPLTGSVNITLTDAKNNKIRIWNNVVLNRGVAGDSFVLSDLVHFGNWKISVSGAGMASTTDKTFAVQHYVLPKYEVKLEFPTNYLLFTPENETSYLGYVRAKYTFGKPVRGKATVSLIKDCYYRPYYSRSRWQNPDQPFSPTPLWTKELTLKADGSPDDGKVNFEGLNRAILAFDLDNNGPLTMSRSDCQVSFMVNVTEDLTGEAISADNQQVTLYREPYKIKLHESVAKTLKPGLPFTARFQVTQPDDAPVSSPVQLTLSYKTSTSAMGCYGDYTPDSTNVVVTDSAGMATLEIQVPNGAESLVFKAHLNAFTEVKLCESRSIPRTRSKQAVSISLDRQDSKRMPKVGDTVRFNIKTSFPTSYIYFMLAQNGQTFKYQKIGGNNDAKMEFSIEALLPEEAAPRCAAIVWTVENSKHEVLADAVEFKVDGLVKQTVEAKFTPAVVKPGEQTQLSVKTGEAGSLVAMFAVDKSVRLLRSGNDITLDDVVGSVGTKTTYGYDSYRPVSPVMWRCWRCGWWPYFVDSSNANQVFQGVGMYIKSNAHTDGRREIFPMYAMRYEADMALDEAPPVMMMAKGNVNLVSLSNGPAVAEEMKAPSVRVLFPETWFWNTTNTESPIYEQSLTAPDTITTWLFSAFAIGDQKGFGSLQQPAELTVFQPFFVNLDIPYPVVYRNEQFAIKAVVFNYQTTPQQIALTLKKSNDFEISLDGGNNYASVTLKTSLNVSANNGESLTIWLKPRHLGEITLELEGVSMVDKTSRDAMQKKILVEPEGEQRWANRPVFIRRENDLSVAPLNVTIKVDELFGNVPKSQVVDGSRYFQLQAIGDILGPALTQLGHQIRLPTGCGEQTMVILAPNVYIYKYLKAVNALTPELEEKTTSFVMQGYQRELTYQRGDGGFSAFGNNDPASSLWLTTFVMRCFQAAAKYVRTPIDQNVIDKSWRFIKQEAANDGTFNEPGKVLHHDMKGGATSKVNLAAYVYATFAEAGGDVAKFGWPNLQTTRSLLIYEAQNETNFNAYQMALVAYAMSMLPEDKAFSEEILDRLLNQAEADGDLKYWPSNQQQSKIETAAYALLALCNFNRLEDATGVARWLMSQRNSLGGFSSTQDTVVGLQALAEFAAKLAGVQMNLKLTATMHFGDRGQPLTKEFYLTPSNAMLLQSFNLPRSRQSLKNVHISASGLGVGLIQLALRYNLKPEKLVDTGDFELIVIEEFSAFRRKRRSADQEDSTALIKSCIRAKTQLARNGGMVVAEVGIPTGFEGDLEETKAMNPISTQFSLKKIELNDQKFVFYFDEITEATCVTSKLTRKSDVKNAQKPVARVYSYYEPLLRSKSTTYSFSTLPEAPTEQETDSDQSAEPMVAKPWIVEFISATFAFLNSLMA